MEERRGAALWSLAAGRSVARWWRGGGDSIAQKRTGWPPFLSLCLLVRRWRGGERLAMAWTVRQQTEERNGRRGRRHPSPWSSPFLFFLLCPTSPPEGIERGRGGKDGRQSRRCPGSLSFSSSVPLLFPSLLAFVLSLYIIRYRHNKDKTTN